MDIELLFEAIEAERHAQALVLQDQAAARRIAGATPRSGKQRWISFTLALRWPRRALRRLGGLRYVALGRGADM